MPKVAADALPVSGLFAVAKPSGPTSMSVVEDIKRLIGGSRLFVDKDKLEQRGKAQGKRKHRNREGAKIGQGGTLDPLADGVLVIGVGKGTKKLGEFLDCVKEYRSTCLMGCETDSYDSEGARVRLAPWRHVNREDVEEAMGQFRGNIEQTPPIFSALKMDGKPLYEYARKGIPLPRPIEKRSVNVLSLELIDWKGSDHAYRWPEKALSEDEKKAVEVALSSVAANPTVKDKSDAADATDTANAATAAVEGSTDVPTAFALSMTVSGGTYVRSIVHDLAHAVGSAGHVVTLTRSRQGRFALEPTGDGDLGCVPWDVFARAAQDVGERDADGWSEWERAVMDKLEVLDR